MISYGSSPLFRVCVSWLFRVLYHGHMQNVNEKQTPVRGRCVLIGPCVQHGRDWGVKTACCLCARTISSCSLGYPLGAPKRCACVAAHMVTALSRAACSRCIHTGAATAYVPGITCYLCILSLSTNLTGGPAPRQRREGAHGEQLGCRCVEQQPSGSAITEYVC